ncbi:hypothetical protein KKB18_11575 [bacterium]|nr:hypothetical protein [bacterium]
MPRRIKILEEDMIRAKAIVQNTKDVREMRGAIAVLLAALLIKLTGNRMLGRPIKGDGSSYEEGVFSWQES